VNSINDNRCLSCGKQSLELLHNFGQQPPCNRFLQSSETPLDTHPLILNQCAECGLIQLKDPMPVSMVRSSHAWLTYNEPEGHLDSLVQYLTMLVKSDAKIFGLTYKDDSTLKRFNQQGYPQTLRFNTASDLGIDDPCAGLETIQAVIDDALVDNLVAEYGKADLLIARHVLEHAHEPSNFIKSLCRLLAPGGQIVLEIPDCRKFINACYYSFIWEEHISYFSPITITKFAYNNGFNVTETMLYPYALEDSLVVMIQLAEGQLTAMDHDAVAQELTSGQHFADAFDSTRLSYQNHFKSLQQAGKHIAVFGAGHLAAKFINLFKLKDYVDFVIDDSPHKQGLTMPGSELPIVGSSRLSEVDLCMLSLSPESEQNVRVKQSDYIQKGGCFASIFSRNPTALKLK